MKVYAIYKGEENLFDGTARECAEHFNVKRDTVYFWNSPANKRKDKKRRKIAIIIEED